jgi:hypothetical protein
VTRWNTLPKQKAKHKYGAKSCIVTEDGTLFTIEEIKKYNLSIQGNRFDSMAEAQYYLSLRDLEMHGEITHIELQPAFILQESPKIKYVADFKVIWADGREEILDVKGVETQAFRIKMRLFKAKYPDKSLWIVKRKGREWQVKEVS